MQAVPMITRGGNPAASQFILYQDGEVLFQSYDSIIAKRVCEDGEQKTYLDEYFWDHSVTTGQYRNQFLCEKKADTARKIKTGEYILADLNNNV